MDLLDAIADEAGPAFIREFAEAGSYTPAGGSARAIRGVFDLAADVVDIGEMIQRDGVAAVYTVETAEVPELALGDAMTVRDVDYRVVGNEPDGTGHTRVVLGI